MAEMEKGRKEEQQGIGKSGRFCRRKGLKNWRRCNRWGRGKRKGSGTREVFQPVHEAVAEPLLSDPDLQARSEVVGGLQKCLK